MNTKHSPDSRTTDWWPPAAVRKPVEIIHVHVLLRTLEFNVAGKPAARTGVQGVRVMRLVALMMSDATSPDSAAWLRWVRDSAPWLYVSQVPAWGSWIWTQGNWLGAIERRPVAAHEAAGKREGRRFIGAAMPDAPRRNRKTWGAWAALVLIAALSVAGWWRHRLREPVAASPGHAPAQPVQMPAAAPAKAVTAPQPATLAEAPAREVAPATPAVHARHAERAPAHVARHPHHRIEASSKKRAHATALAREPVSDEDWTSLAPATRQAHATPGANANANDTGWMNFIAQRRVTEIPDQFDRGNR